MTNQLSASNPVTSTESVALRNLGTSTRARVSERRQAESWPDTLSDWALPPPAARAIGEVEPVRVFDTAEAALAYLVGLYAPGMAAHRRAR